MAQRVEIRSATCPPNTTQAAAIETDLSFRPGIVRAVEIVIPPGPAGQTGLALAQAHQVVIPASGTVWIISDGEVIRWPFEDFLNTGSWSAFTYNLDPVNAHSWFFRFLVDEVPHVVARAASAIPAGDIEAQAVAAAAAPQTGGQDGSAPVEQS